MSKQDSDLEDDLNEKVDENYIGVCEKFRNFLNVFKHAYSSFSSLGVRRRKIRG